MLVMPEFGWLLAFAMPGPGQLMLMMLVFGWLLGPAGAHDARLWRFSCGPFCPADAHDARLWQASFPVDATFCPS